MKVDWASTTGKTGWCRRAWTCSTLPTHPSPPLLLATTTRQPSQRAAPSTPGAEVMQRTLDPRCPAACLQRLGLFARSNRLVPTLVPRQLLGGASMGRCHGLREELALAFTMGTHEWLDASSAAAGGGGGKRRAQGKAPAAGREEEGCPYLMMPADLVKRVVEACGWRAEGELGEGVVRLMGGRRTSGEI